MEREPINREKESRIIQQKSGTKGQVNIVDNREKSIRSLMSGGMVSQRVIQRVNEANGKFIFAPYQRSAEFRVPFQSKFIYFTVYQPPLILSGGFNGCYLMVFQFNTTKPAAELNALLRTPSDIVTTGETFVAHVASDARDVFWDAVNRGLITIVANMRPYNGITKTGRTEERYGPTSLSRGQAAIDRLTGGMRRYKDSHGHSFWEGLVLTQERVPDVWEVEKNLPKEQRTDFTNVSLQDSRIKWHHAHIVETIKPSEMGLMTDATNAYIYARVCIDAFVDGDNDKMYSALGRLYEIRNQQREALKLAWEEVLIPDEDGHISIKAINGKFISDFLRAIYERKEGIFFKRFREMLGPASIRLSPSPALSSAAPITPDPHDLVQSETEQTEVQVNTEETETDLDDDDDD